MLGSLMNFFGLSPKADYAQLRKEGAIIVDVRSKSEFKAGHIAGSINIPLDELKSTHPFKDKKTPIITCCASGMRSAAAKSLLKSLGYQNVHNGGGWNSLQKNI